MAMRMAISISMAMRMAISISMAMAIAMTISISMAKFNKKNQIPIIDRLNQEFGFKNI